MLHVPKKPYFYIRGLLIIIQHKNLLTLLLVLFGYYLLPVLLMMRHLNSFLAQGQGDLNKTFSKIQMPRALLGGGGDVEALI